MKKCDFSKEQSYLYRSFCILMTMYLSSIQIISKCTYLCSASTIVFHKTSLSGHHNCLSPISHPRPSPIPVPPKSQSNEKFHQISSRMIKIHSGSRCSVEQRKAELRTYHFKTPLQSIITSQGSQPIVCVITPRMYHKAGTSQQENISHKNLRSRAVVYINIFFGYVAKQSSGDFKIFLMGYGMHVFFLSVFKTDGI